MVVFGSTANGTHRQPPQREQRQPGEMPTVPGPAAPARRYGKLGDVAAFTGLSERTIRRHTAPRGPLSCIRIGDGAGVIYDFEDVVRWLDSLKVRGPCDAGGGGATAAGSA